MATEHKKTSTSDQTDIMTVNHSLNSLALASAGAIISAVCMLLLGILATVGIYESAAEMMMAWHMFFTLTIGGIVAGMIEAAIIVFIGLYVFSWTYNIIAERYP